MASAASLLFGMLGGMGEGAPWVPPQPSGPPPGELALIPPASSPIVASLRPPVERILQVGADKPFSKIGDALDQASRIQRVFADTPWVGISVDPGVYTDEPAKMGLKKIAIFSSSGKPRSVTIRAGFDYAVAPFYLEGLVIDSRGLVGPKYSIHANIVGASAVVAQSELYYTQGTDDTGFPVGTDGGNGGYSLFYDVVMHGSRTNNHGAANQTRPFKQVYVKVRANGGLEYNGLNNSQPDGLWVIDSQVAWAGMSQSPNGVYYASEPRPPLGSAGFDGGEPVTVDSGAWPRPVWEV